MSESKSDPSIRKLVAITVLGLTIAVLPFCCVFAPFLSVMVHWSRLASQDCDCDAAPSADWLPAEATDIYCRGHGLFKFYEFSISELGFRAYADGLGVDLREAGDDDYVRRYVGWSHDLDGTLSFSPKEEQHPYLHMKSQNGLFGELRGADHGGHTLLYDRATRRAYCEYAHH